MPLLLNQVVPWGRSLDEYTRMFGLTRADLDSRILGCGDGPASFNAELTHQGGRVVSVDPIYHFTTEQIAGRIEDVRQTMLDTTREHAHAFLWDEFGSPEELGKIRRAIMRVFLDDYRFASASGRYVAGALPNLPFAAGTFDLALCSHYLFTYGNILDEPFHVAAIREMLRVAGSVRIFPLFTMFDGGRSPHLPGVIKNLEQAGFRTQIRRVAYEFQRGGNEMLEIASESA